MGHRQPYTKVQIDTMEIVKPVKAAEPAAE